MYIIGTAGHVDHGKTELIKALTGIDTDRLPEEKKRGLTIDLGFAHFKDHEGREIGVIDVPGHEKFIRNMVAGAWGIDLALLVIAADDGWMFQTENHLRVLTAMGINKIIAVITKSDLREKESIAETMEDAKLRLLEKTGLEVPAISVSVMTGENLQALKELIITELSSPESQTKAESEKPLLYIDRAFNIKGAGLVVTGSLRGGSIRKNDGLLMLPDSIPVRVRSIQTYDTETDAAFPACRTALNLSGTDSEKAGRGCCLTSGDSGYSAETEFIMELDYNSEKIRNHSEAEFAAGTAHAHGSIHFLNRGEAERSSLRARIVLSEQLVLSIDQPVVIIRKGGSMITGSGKVIWKGISTQAERKKIAFSAETDTQSLGLAVKGYTKSGNGWIFEQTVKKELKTEIGKLAADAGGIRIKELPGKLKVPEEPLKQLLDELVESGELTEKNGIFFRPGNTETKLSPNAKKILEEIQKGGSSGIDLGRIKIPGAQKELRMLTRAGLIVPLTDNLFLTEEEFSRLCGKILEGLRRGASFDISHAKERTGLSRKYIIPILNRMEERRLVRREDNLRLVL